MKGLRFGSTWTKVSKFCIVRMVLIALLSIWGAQFALAQVTAAMSGRVEDPSGAGIAGATVTVTSEETGASRTITTDDDGGYLRLNAKAYYNSGGVVLP